MAIPNNMDFTPFDILTAEQMDNLIENDVALAAGTALDTGAVTTAKLADDSVTAAKVDWATTGANGGIWWEELGRTSLSVAGDTVSVTGIPARKYLKIFVAVQGTGGTIAVGIRANNDSGTNYSWRFSPNGGADVTFTGDTSFLFTGAATYANFVVTGEIVNILAQEKLMYGARLYPGAAGSGTVPERAEGVFKWANTAAQITRLDVVNVSGTGDFAIGSELVVLGHN